MSKQVAKQATEKQTVNNDVAEPKQAAVFPFSAIDMPVSCPMPGQNFWNQLQRSFMALDEKGVPSGLFYGNRFQLRRS